MSRESFDRVFDVNANGVVRTVEAALPEIVRRRGHVVVVASVYAFVNGVGAIPYAMSKAAVEQLGRALRVELVRHGASASVAYFGFIDTEMVHRGIDDDPLTAEMLEHAAQALRKRLTPPQAGEAVVVDGIERRQARIIVPRRWIAMSACAASSARCSTRARSATPRRRRSLARARRARATRSSRRRREAYFPLQAAVVEAFCVVLSVK